ncbi:MAG: DUF4398 domain-containing protein [Hydrogenophaga sp.]|jgi:hypothetical protein|uniref:DUF4398 domain-containing protein n=1 Tax=Hydrogenophaga sp. TaxID=1904254 RepID=UPI00272346BE|nr:DUF4398 domain-containing protein [Hydrogenophaga sp.]MDO9201585.1 DUF4398 domain-containing protein [Hydrogenophaga sp.]MDO9481821.1 DUF4398 domain-containing protein [Hydrogenophaga sp.]MDO9568635.1 DUF4398 domain-containing protein [Hydrogenophaga sp.]MDP1895519.1 DUF4398 domain-containing protein [Hydrogenophaga sp.]MDP2094600.1 DUF4398 domain-containing protein [Hydrogenophaga sp.]
MNASFKPAARPATLPAAARHTLPGLSLVVLVAAALQMGCASLPAPTEQMAVTTAAVASAERAGAVALAPAEMALARDKLARANASMVEEKYERAQMLAEAALVDARLAEAKARNAQAAQAATELREGNRVLRQEMERAAQ